MKQKIEAEEVEISLLKLTENSRLRTEEDLSPLMESIKQIGVIEPILARREDNVVICGNRRLEASRKLGNKTIPVFWRENVSDEDLLIINLAENMQRKSISTIEIGRICDILAEKGLRLDEISARLGINSSRIKICLYAFKHTPKEFREKIKNITSIKSKMSAIPEGVFWALVKLNERRRFTDEEFKFLLQRTLDEKWTVQDIHLLRTLFPSGKPVHEIVEMKDSFVTKNFQLAFNKEELERELKEEGLVSFIDFVRLLLRQRNKKLIL